jgi:hypothetical protein
MDYCRGGPVGPDSITSKDPSKDGILPADAKKAGMLMHAAERQQCATNLLPSIHRRIVTLHGGVFTLVFAWRVELQLPGLFVAKSHS